jgi:hypothetical protein
LPIIGLSLHSGALRFKVYLILETPTKPHSTRSACKQADMNRLRTAVSSNRRITALLFSFCAAFSPSSQSQSIDIGEASVQSQQGQRLKIVVPFGSAAGQRVTPLRFSVEDVQAPAGYLAPSVNGFTISKPDARNFVVLHSREVVDAPSISLAVRVSNQAQATQRFNLAVPPAQMVRSEPMPTAKAPIRKMKKRSKKTVQAKYTKPKNTKAVAVSIAAPVATTATKPLGK